MTARNVAAMVVRLMLVQLALPPVARVALAQGADTVDKSCVGGRWTPPHPLHTAEGYTIAMDRPAILPLRGETFMTAFPVATFDSTGTVVWPLSPSGKTPQVADQYAIGALEDGSGVARLVPAPSHLTVAPFDIIGAVDERGVAHLAWGSVDSSAGASLMLKRSVWYARFDGGKWSTPVPILTTPNTIVWIPSNRSPLVAHGHTAHLATAVMGEGLRYLRFDGTDWSERHVGIPSWFAGYPEVAVLSHGRLVMIVQAGVPSPLTDAMSGIFATWSDDGGVTWASPVHISDVDGEPAYEDRLLVDDHDALYALWLQQTNDVGEPALHLTLGGSPGRIHIARSTDGGASWQRLPATPLLAHASGLEAVVMHNDTVLAAVVDAPHAQIITTSWSGRWGSLQSHDAKPDPFNPSLGLDGAHRPVLTWGIRHRRGWSTTMVSTFAPCP